jgi:hypothetical protein
MSLRALRLVAPPACLLRPFGPRVPAFRGHARSGIQKADSVFTTGEDRTGRQAPLAQGEAIYCTYQRLMAGMGTDRVLTPEPLFFQIARPTEGGTPSTFSGRASSPKGDGRSRPLKGQTSSPLCAGGASAFGGDSLQNARSGLLAMTLCY